MGAYTEIVDYTVPSDTTSVALNDFGTITKDDFIKITITYVNPTGSFSGLALVPTSNTNLSNYSRQELGANGTTVTSARSTSSPQSGEIGGAPANDTSVITGYIKISENEKYNVFANEVRTISSAVRNVFNYITQDTGTTSSITSLSVISRITDGIGTGSRIQIYRLDAEKVADFTTTSNSTQVDIPVTGSLDPAINKDSEYLLVSDIVNPQSNTSYNMTVNDTTTTTAHNSQRIRGAGTSASADRANSPFSFSALSTKRNLAYSHIKLSEIGAFTSQNYSVNDYGTASVVLQNIFVSSTAENITSITKLNVFGNAANSIGSGTRFILYKLK
jgi:hypothetical protein